MFWAWPEEFDDALSLCLLSFSPPQADLKEGSSAPFDPRAAKKSKRRLTSARERDPKFRFNVLRRYGALCAVCDLDQEKLLEAAHIVAKEFEGTDDPRNGLVLCRNHHRAFDTGMFCFDPKSSEVQLRSPFTRDELRISRSSLAHLEHRPAVEALEIVFAAWVRSSK